MATPIQNPDAAQQVVEALGVKGRFGLQVDSVLVPTMITDQLQNSPYQVPRPVGRQLNALAGGAGRFGVVGVSPPAGNILFLEQVFAVNNTGAAVSFTLSFLTAAEIAALANLATFDLFLFNRRNVTVGTAGSRIFRGDNAVAGVGDQFATVTVPANDLRPIVLPRGATIDGDDPTGVPGLALVAQVANTVIGSSFFCTEYPPRG